MAFCALSLSGVALTLSINIFRELKMGLKNSKLIMMSFFITILSFVIINTSWAEPNVDKAAPEFSLIDAKGKKHSLSDYRGKYVVLEWLNHDCPFVKKHYGSGNMQKLQKKFTSEGVLWFSIISSVKGKQGHLSPEEALKITAKKEAHPTAVLLDVDGKVGRLYGAKTTPHMFVIDKDGILRYMGAIDDQRGTNPQRIAEANNYVVMALQNLAEGKDVNPNITKPYGCSVKY